MVRGIYTSAWSMLAISKKMDVVSNNIANVNTNAFKKDTVVFQSFPEVLANRINDNMTMANPSGQVGNMSLGNDIGEIFTYYNAGQLNKTDNKFDMSIVDSDTSFFTIGKPDEKGEIKNYYTRDGAFSLNSKGELVTKEGDFVMGENGKIVLAAGDISIKEDGTVSLDGNLVDKLVIKNFENPKTLRKVGENYLQTTNESKEKPFDGSVKQGMLELSNVNIVKEMVDMITVMRSYEANQKMLQFQDNTLEKVVNEVGAVR